MDKKQLKTELDLILKEFGYNGAVCVFSKGHMTYAGANGMADWDKNLPITPETTFFTASVTKQFTAVSVMMLYERGLVSLEDTLDKYIPEYSHAAEITLRQTLNMAGGIPDYMNDIIDPAIEKEENNGRMSDIDFFRYCCDSCSKNYTFDEILGYVNELPLRFAPGSKMEYSNTGYYFLGVIVEKVTGMPIGQFMTENIFNPLGMTDTNVGKKLPDAICFGDFNGGKLDIGTCRNTSGDACVITNVYDLSKWLQAVIMGKLLKKETWKLVFDMGDRNYGFGYRSIDGWNYHCGALKLYRSGTYIHFKKRLTIAMLASSENGDYGRDKEYCIERRLRRSVEDFYTVKPGKVKLVKITKDTLDECLEMKVKPEQRAFIRPTAELLAEAYTDGTVKPYMALDGSRYVGFVCLKDDKKSSSYGIKALFVAERLQNRGYGKAVLNLAVAALAKDGAESVSAHVSHSNDGAAEFFTHCGFEKNEQGDYIYKIK